MAICSVVYVSDASSECASDRCGLGSPKLDWLVDDAARFNLHAGVTGVLLFDGARFLQYPEGPEDGVRVAYGRVRDATSHANIVELQHGLVANRHFPFWPMRWLPGEPGRISELAAADWTDFTRDSGAGDRAGIDMLAAVVAPYVASV